MTFLLRSLRPIFRHYSTNAPKERKKFFGKALAIGLVTSYGYYMYANYQDAKRKEKKYDLPAYKLSLYRLLPVNIMTQLAGKLAEIRVAEPLRAPIYGLYAALFGCNLDEALLSDYSKYETFNQFFTRALRPGVRPISDVDLVSPADGKIMALGKLSIPFPMDSNEALLFPEQIKGISYPLKKFVSEELFQRLSKSKYDLYYCTIYLSPGDYHRFHSPAVWKQTELPARINGETLSVAPFMMRWVKNLFCLNERIIMSGNWEHGEFVMVTVGATNVSSIRLEDNASKGSKFTAGEPIGTFELGSTIVLILNGPSDFKWTMNVGEKIKMGQSLGEIPKRYYLINGLL